MITGNEPAFATPDNGNEFMTTWEGQTGLTIRQHFAAMAMQGILSDQTYVRPNSTEEVSRCAVAMADALIAELNKSK